MNRLKSHLSASASRFGSFDKQCMVLPPRAHGQPTGFRFLRLALVGGILLTAGASAGLAATLQAESAVLAGGTVAETTNAGYHGTGYANSSTTGGTITFNNVNGEGGGAKSLAIRYANGTTAARAGNLVVNGVTTGISFQPTGAWTTWSTLNVGITLNNNSTNTIQFASTGSDLGNIDEITIPAAVGIVYTPQGYGAVATGGSTVFHVTNLNDTGTGSLRDALSASGRRIVFDVSGTITIASTLVIKSTTTIDGTTAPGGGITVTGYNTSMSGASNVIVRNMRFREDTTGPSGKCALQGAPADTVMIDHCSIEWGCWDCLEFTSSSHDITIQNCIIGQGIDPQHFGCLIDGGDRISIHHNLWIGNDNRNPKLKGNCQYINNVVYNWGSAGGLQGGHSAAVWTSDVIGNYFIKGPSSGNDNWSLDCTSTDQWFTSGNFLDLDKNGSLNGAAITTAQYNTLGVTLLASQQHNPSAPVTVDSASTTVSKAAAGNYGCQPLDAYDTAEVGYLKSYGTTGKIGK
jgi:hypothetical protein